MNNVRVKWVLEYIYAQAWILAKKQDGILLSWIRTSSQTFAVRLFHPLYSLRGQSH